MKRTRYILLLLSFACLLIKGCEKEPADQYLTDIDGNRYSIVQIGSKTWMAENLNTGRVVQSSDRALNNDTIEKYCYDNDEANCEIFGGLYSWVNTRGSSWALKGSSNSSSAGLGRP